MPLTPVPLPTLDVSTGVPIPFGTVLGEFSDANPTAPITDFTAIIDWGNGLPNSIGTITQPDPGISIFDVTYDGPANGPNEYPTFGTYGMSIVVEDVGGSVVTLTNTVDVTDLAVTDAVDNFGAVEGQNTGTIVLATFEDPNTLATTSSVTASLPAGGWGDGTPAASATLAVQQIGLDPSTGDPIFEVLGNHTYAEEGTFTVNINVTTSGGVTTALTPGTATVLDAPLLGSAGTEITGVEGSSTGTVLLGTFVDANQFGADDDSVRLHGHGQLGRRLDTRDAHRRQLHADRYPERHCVGNHRRLHLHRGGDLCLHGDGDRRRRRQNSGLGIGHHRRRGAHPRVTHNSGRVDGSPDPIQHGARRVHRRQSNRADL